MEGFWRLSNARPQGMNGPLYIPISEIEAYSRLKEFDYSRRQEFFLYLGRLDDKFMEYVRKVQEEEERKRTNNPVPPKPKPGAIGR